MTAQLSVDVQVASSSRSVPPDENVQCWVAAVLNQLDYNDNVEISVRIVDEDESRGLNKAYREKDKPTNVLSFPSGIGDYAPDDEPRPLGDIVICAPVVEHEAALQGKDASDHWAHLVVHGTLHLIGFNHETDAEACAMEAIEREILAAQGVADPYEARGQQS
ncbi:MAG: rRNA maturation RNase YbeY [Gammaproteobacteria bacterium]|nr:rRNA maturation RNase YbeY [Gammaproteobacteria bacterium]